MRRVYFLVEGLTELNFIRHLLYDHLIFNDIFSFPIIITTKIKKGIPTAKGGYAKYRLARNEILRLLNQKDNPVVTTMIDYYGLPNDYPGKNNLPTGDCYNRIKYLQEEFAKDINNLRFIPYFQLHEYEAILFSSPEILTRTMMESNKISEVLKICSQFNTPEEIDDNPNTAPSKRLLKLFNGYQKPHHGSLVSIRTGLDKIRNKCPHFNKWLSQLESLR